MKFYEAGQKDTEAFKEFEIWNLKLWLLFKRIEVFPAEAEDDLRKLFLRSALFHVVPVIGDDASVEGFDCEREVWVDLFDFVEQCPFISLMIVSVVLIKDFGYIFADVHIIGTARNAWGHGAAVRAFPEKGSSF